MSSHLIPHQLARLLYTLTLNFNERKDIFHFYKLHGWRVEIKSFSNNSVTCIYRGIKFGFHFRIDKKRNMICSRAHYHRFEHYFKPEDISLKISP